MWGSLRFTTFTFKLLVLSGDEEVTVCKLISGNLCVNYIQTTGVFRRDSLLTNLLMMCVLMLFVPWRGSSWGGMAFATLLCPCPSVPTFWSCQSYFGSTVDTGTTYTSARPCEIMWHQVRDHVRSCDIMWDHVTSCVRSINLWKVTKSRDQVRAGK